MPGFSCLAPGSWSPEPLGDTWPRRPSCWLGRREPLWQGPSRPPGLNAPCSVRDPQLERSGTTTSLPKGKVEHLLRGGGEPGSVPTSKSPVRVGGKPSRKGARTARARLHPLFRRAGWAQAAANSRHRLEPGARRGLWGRRVSGPARPCPPARHARLRLQVPGEAQAAAAVPAVREAHARARAGFYLRPPLL